MNFYKTVISYLLLLFPLVTYGMKEACGLSDGPTCSFFAPLGKEQPSANYYEWVGCVTIIGKKSWAKQGISKEEYEFLQEKEEESNLRYKESNETKKTFLDLNKSLLRKRRAKLIEKRTIAEQQQDAQKQEHLTTKISVIDSKITDIKNEKETFYGVMFRSNLK